MNGSVCRSTPLDGSVNWPWSVTMLAKARAWEAKLLRLYADDRWIGYKQRTALSLRIKWRKLGLPTLVEKLVDKFWTTTNWAVYNCAESRTFSVRISRCRVNSRVG